KSHSYSLDFHGLSIENDLKGCSKTSWILKKILHIHNRYKTSGDIHDLNLIIHLLDKLISKLETPFTYSNKIPQRIKYKISLLILIRDIRNSIIRVIKKHFKRLSDVSGSD